MMPLDSVDLRMIAKNYFDNHGRKFRCFSNNTTGNDLKFGCAKLAQTQIFFAPIELLLRHGAGFGAKKTLFQALAYNVNCNCCQRLKTVQKYTDESQKLQRKLLH